MLETVNAIKKKTEKKYFKLFVKKLVFETMRNWMKSTVELVLRNDPSNLKVMNKMAELYNLKGNSKWRCRFMSSV